MKDKVQFGTKLIDFHVEFTDRKSLGIKVTPELGIFVKSPRAIPIEKIREKVTKKAKWIIKQQNHFLAFYPKITPRKYVNGETYLYLGRQYRLKVVLHTFSNSKNAVNLKGKYLEVYTNNLNKIETLVKRWYRKKAKDILLTYAEVHFTDFILKYNLSDIPFQFTLREMKSRWGSCTKGGRIILNPELVKAPKGCIEYVIVHELCHLIYPAHTPKFYELQATEMPTWKKWKTKLEKTLA